MLVEVVPHSANIGPKLVGSGQICPMEAELGPNLAELGPNLANIGHTVVGCCRPWPTLVESGQNLAKLECA